MFCFQRYTRLLLKLITSARGRQQNLSLGKDLMYHAVPCFPYDNIVGSRLCDECKKSILLVVCHMPESILWLIFQSRWPTIFLCFSTHPTYWNKRMTSKNAQCSSRSGFRILKNSREVRVLKQSRPALFSTITHTTILFVFTCVMNVWNRAIQAFVTGIGRFSNRSSKFVDRP